MLDADDIEHASRISELDGMLVASLAPDLGPEGLEQFARAVMRRVAVVRWRAVVLDCSAVLVMDGQEFARLAELGDMCRLLGVHAYLAALHPGIAIHLALAQAQAPGLRFCRDLDHARDRVETEAA
ncbi:MAG: anti-anti-sigma factor [Comamonadaceae bacterium]|jgi:anti-anti-sigma regulatory factor|nr:anti-anti-sigma factor [Comamonadaceae bacterium]